MIAIDKANKATIANRRLVLYVQAKTSAGDVEQGSMIDPSEASYEIFNDAYTSVKAKTLINLADAPTGSRIGLGRFAVAWDPTAPDRTVGTYFVRWYYKIESADEERFFDQEIELVAVPYKPGAPHYCTVGELVAQGLPSTVSAAQAQRLIERASRYAEHFIGRGPLAFEPQFKTVRLDGTGGRAVQFNEPLISVGEIHVVIDNVFNADNKLVITSALKIYNRHLTQNLLSPDDRDNPKLEFVHGADLGGLNYDPSAGGYRLTSLAWPKGQQNIQVAGVFGFTEPDESFVGQTPAMLREAVMLLAFLNAPLAGSEDAQSNRRASRLTLEATRDQSQQFAAPGTGPESQLFGGFTGDPAIDMLLVQFRRGPIFGSV